MASYSVGELKKGLKVQIDGDPFTIAECNFVKPGKGQAMYKLKLKNLIKGTVLDRTLRSGDSIEAADVSDTEAQFLYAQGDTYVFMDSSTFEQYEVGTDQMDSGYVFLKEGMVCSVTLWNGQPISISPPNHVVLQVEYTEPAARGNTATNLQKPAKLETGAEVSVPAFVENGDMIKVDTRTSEYVERVKE